MANEIAVKVEDVSFTYPDGHEVLKSISCTMRHGEKIALIGPNGAGKSTFMSLLNGVEMPTAGKVTIGGLEISKENLNQIRRKVGIVFQDPDDQLFCPTVFDDVAFGPLNLGLSPTDALTRARTVLKRVGMAHALERAPYHLSAG